MLSFLQAPFTLITLVVTPKKLEEQKKAHYSRLKVSAFRRINALGYILIIERIKKFDKFVIPGKLSFYDIRKILNIPGVIKNTLVYEQKSGI